MSVRVSGFAKGLVRCLDFESVSVEELDRVLVGAAETLEMDYVDPSADTPFIQSGSPSRTWSLSSMAQRSPGNRLTPSSRRPS